MLGRLMGRATRHISATVWTMNSVLMTFARPTMVSLTADHCKAADNNSAAGVRQHVGWHVGLLTHFATIRPTVNGHTQIGLLDKLDKL